METDEIRRRIAEYVRKYSGFYAKECNLTRFFADCPEAREYAEEALRNEPWFETVENVLSLTEKGVFERCHCPTCGKEITLEAVKRGSRYCSGGCKSHNREVMEQERLQRIENEKIYEVDLSVPVPDDVAEMFRLNGSRPNAEVQQKIADFYSRDRKGMGLYKLLKENRDVDLYLTFMVRIHPWMENKKRAYWFVKNGLYEGKRCKQCGKLLTFRQIKEKHEFCSLVCSSNNEETKRKSIATSRSHYGTDAPMKSDVVKERLQKAIFARYGVKNVSLSREICEKRHQTIMERYGVDSYTQTEEYLRKCRETDLKKYGVEYHAVADVVKQKQRETNLARYGCENPFQNEEIKQRIKETCLDKYGVDHASKNDECKKKTHDSRMRTLYRRMLALFADKVVPLFSEEKYMVNGFTDRSLMWKCVVCGCEFNEYHEQKTTAFHGNSPFPRCPVCYPRLYGTSIGEKEIKEFVASLYDGEIKQGVRNVIAPYELDVYLPERNFAIEFDGLYWHSEKQGKDSDYHLNKTEACEAKGIRLIHVFEDEWLNHREIVEDRIKSILGVGQRRVFARKCELRELDAETANDFLEANHLQGMDGSSFRCGLFHDGELVAVMTFGRPRFGGGCDWELIRFASRLGIHVAGGASKLLAYFRKTHSGSIVSYADRRYSDGRLYEALGFRLKNVSKPNYWYVKGEEKLSRYACQKHRLPKLLGEGFNQELSEFENMAANGWSRVHDCGNLVYVLD